MKYTVTDEAGTRTVYAHCAEMAVGWSKKVWEERGISVVWEVYDESFDRFFTRQMHRSIESHQSEIQRLKELKASSADFWIKNHEDSAREDELAIVLLGRAPEELNKFQRARREYWHGAYMLELERMYKRNPMSVAPAVLAEAKPAWVKEWATIKEAMEKDTSIAECFALAL